LKADVKHQQFITHIHSYRNFYPIQYCALSTVQKLFVWAHI